MSKRILSLALAILMTMGLATPTLAAEGKTTSFSDVDPDAWYTPYIEICAQSGVVQGDGQGQFLPGKVLGSLQGTAMLLRLHSALNDEGGRFPTPPEDWLPLWVADGKETRLFSASECAGWGGGYGELYFRFNVNAAQLHALDGSVGLVCLGNRRFAGTFSPSEDRENQVKLTLTSQTVSQHDLWELECAFFLIRRSGLSEWEAHVFYYAELHHLDDVVKLGDVWRANEFAAALQQVCDLPQRFSVEYVPHFEREEDPAVYTLREAGIWNGANETGTMDLSYSQSGHTHFCRVDAAILIARVLDPELRLTEDPDPLPHEGYTLTYLMDEPADGVKCTYPVLPTEEGLWTLEGTRVPWPPEVERPFLSYRCIQRGEYLRAAFWRSTPHSSASSSHASGGAGCGGAAGCATPPDLGWFDAAGQLVSLSYNEPPAPPVIERPYVPNDHGVYYAGDRPASQKFDWCGDLDSELRGFVGLDGKVYRIQFEG